jgi:5'-nucleotidase
VAAAMEGYLLGLPSVAISLVSRRHFDFTHAARFATSLVRALLAQGGGRRMLLNVNVPPKEPKGYRITKLGKHSYGYEVVENVDPRGRKYYWIGGSEFLHEDIPGSDCNAVLREGLISVTPLQLDLTDHPMLPGLESWAVDGFAKPGG